MEKRGCELSCAGFCSSLRRLGASIGLANRPRSLEMPQAASFGLAFGMMPLSFRLLIFLKSLRHHELRLRI